jgi:hypothetical protein
VEDELINRRQAHSKLSTLALSFVAGCGLCCVYWRRLCLPDTAQETAGTIYLPGIRDSAREITGNHKPPGTKGPSYPQGSWKRSVHPNSMHAFGLLSLLLAGNESV